MTNSRPSVAVVGVGSTGAMALWQLASRGADVTGFDQFSPGHDRGAHGGETRIFRTAYQESPDYVPLLLRAKHLWRELEAETGARLLDLNGVLTIGSAHTERMANVKASIDDYGLDAEELPADVAMRRYPQHAIGDDEAVVLDSSAGFLRPEQAVLHASRRAVALGARLRTYTRVIAVEPSDRHVAVRTAEGTEHFDHVVVCTGPWAMQLLGGLGYGKDTIEVRRIVQAWFPARDPDLFSPQRCPVFIRVSGTRCYGIPATDGSGLKLGIFAEENHVVDDPDAFDPRVSVDALAGFRAAAARLLPQVYPEPTRVAAYIEGYTADTHGIVGRMPGADRVTLLVGFSGHGFKLAPAFGELGAESALGTAEAPRIPQIDAARVVSRSLRTQ